MVKKEILDLSPDEFLEWCENNKELIHYCVFTHVWHVEDRYDIVVYDTIIPDNTFNHYLNLIKLGKSFGIHFDKFNNILKDIKSDVIKGMAATYCYYNSDDFYILDLSIDTKKQKKYLEKIAERLYKELKFYTKIVEIDDDEEEKQYGYDYRLYFHTDEVAFEKLNN